MRNAYSCVVKRPDFQKHFDCSGVQSYKTNKNKVLYIKQKRVIQQVNEEHINTKKVCCIVCNLSIIDEDYCSVECKVSAVYENGNTEWVTCDKNVQSTEGVMDHNNVKNVEGVTDDNGVKTIEGATDDNDVINTEEAKDYNNVSKSNNQESESVLPSQLDANNKTGLGYGNHVNGCEANDKKPKTDSDNDNTISPISGQPKHTPMKINFVKLVECVDCGENEKQAEKPTSFTQNPKGIGQMETRTVWDNTARVNHQNKLTHPHPKRNFVPAAILTMSRQVSINVAKQSSYKAAASVSAARRVNTVAPRPNVNSARPKTTQDLVIIKLIHRVKRLERELKARTPPTKIQKVI
nr:PLATZ domain-containing protein [Tanacetum cinerariifolium]